jgi:Ca2+-transporting ATPase
MSVQELALRGQAYAIQPQDDAPLPEAFQPLAAAAILASRREPFDPTEQALHDLARRLPQTHRRQDWTLIREYPFSKSLMAVSHVWRSPDDRQHFMATKGAPEAVMRLCGLRGVEAQQLAEAVRAMASKGLRVLGVAAVCAEQTRPPEEPASAGLQWLGLTGLADPLRPEVPQAIRECRTAGVRVVMITGDYPETARQLARQAGLEPVEEVVTGPELDQMDDAALRQRIQATRIFARIIPEQKLRLVNAFKANGEIVAMTGDGVNDAPALKAAHIGIAMGLRGTDVAREAADLVLLDDAFSSIVHAIRAGRRVFDNLKKAMAYVIAVHVPIAGMALIPIAFHWPLVLLPVHIVFLELIIDPACSIAFEAEPEEADVMQRPPRSSREPLFTKRTVGLSLLQGASVLVLALAVFAVAQWRGREEAAVRAMAFTTMVVGNLALILSNRSWSRTIFQTIRQPNPALWCIVGATLVILGSVLIVPALQRVFHFAPLRGEDLMLCLAAGGLSVLWFEWLKRLVRRQAPARTAGELP